MVATAGGVVLALAPLVGARLPRRLDRGFRRLPLRFARLDGHRGDLAVPLPRLRRAVAVVVFAALAAVGGRSCCTGRTSGGSSPAPSRVSPAGCSGGCHGDVARGGAVLRRPCVRGRGGRSRASRRLPGRAAAGAAPTTTEDRAARTLRRRSIHVIYAYPVRRRRPERGWSRSGCRRTSTRSTTGGAGRTPPAMPRFDRFAASAAGCQADILDACGCPTRQRPSRSRDVRDERIVGVGAASAGGRPYD